MSLIILERIDQSSATCNPRFRVQCSSCGIKYITSGNRWKISKRSGCASCAHKGNQNARKKVHNGGPSLAG